MSDFPRSLGWILVAGLFLRLLLASSSWGSQDVTAWLYFRDSIAVKGLWATYVDVHFFNHPPFVGYILGLSANLPWNIFPFCLKLPSILSEVASAYLIHHLIVERDRNTAYFTSAVVALSPMLIAVTGFHGNTDAIFVFLVLLSTYFVVQARHILAGLAFGAALNIKIVPLLVLPVVFLWISNGKARARFSAAMLLLIVFGYGYGFYKIPGVLIDNIFAYNSHSGVWGITLLSNWLGFTATELLVTALKFSIIVLVLLVAMSRAGSGAEGLIKSLGLSILIFMSLTPGYGPQYMSWLVLAAFVSLRGFMLINLFGAVYILALYTSWFGSFPWGYLAVDRVDLIVNALSLVSWVMLAFLTSYEGSKALRNTEVHAK